MNKLALTKIVLFLTVIGMSATYCYLAYGGIASFVSVLVMIVVWILYGILENHYLGKKLEIYAQEFSLECSDGIDKFEISGEFFLRGKHCEGWITFGKDGISIRLGGGFRIPWENIRSITLLRVRSFEVARLYLSQGSIEKSELFVPWTDEFRNRIPKSLLLVDSRS